MSLHKIFLAALLLASTSAAQAKVPPEQMARLDQDLTPLGSERGLIKTDPFRPGLAA